MPLSRDLDLQHMPLWYPHSSVEGGDPQSTKFYVHGLVSAFQMNGKIILGGEIGDHFADPMTRTNCRISMKH